MQLLVYHLPHIAMLLGGAALWDMCSTDNLADLHMTRVVAILGVALVIAFVSYATDPAE